MIVYLDQNHIIDLSKDKARLDKLHKILKKRKATLGISFSHIVDTTSEKLHKRRPIIEVVNKLGYVQMNWLDRILVQEVKNELYRFLNLEDKVKQITPLSSIFTPRIKVYGFENLVEHFCQKQDLVDIVLKRKIDYETRSKALRSSKSLDEAIKEEKDELLNFYIKYDLTEDKMDLRIKLPRASLDAQAFKRQFVWERCPYLKFYSLFITLKSRDRTRGPRGDLSDLEHATAGSLSCDMLCTEKNNFEIIKQAVKRGAQINAKPFKKLDEAIDFIEKN